MTLRLIGLTSLGAAFIFLTTYLVEKGSQ